MKDRYIFKAMPPKRKPAASKPAKYKNPTKKACQDALGFLASETVPEEYLNKKDETGPAFLSIPRPLVSRPIGDGWVVSDALVLEPDLKPQSVEAFRSKASRLSYRHTHDTIFIIPVGEIPTDFDLQSVIRYIDVYYLGLKVVLQAPLPIVRDRKDRARQNTIYVETNPSNYCKVATRPGRDVDETQVSMADMMVALVNVKPRNAFAVIGLTALDMFQQDDDFICGCACETTRTAIVSIARYDPCFKTSRQEAGKRTVSERLEQRSQHDIDVWTKRIMKCAVHELGHCLGIDHCGYWSCMMQSSGNLAEDDEQPMHVCPVDLRKLQLAVGFDVRQRYERLSAFYGLRPFLKEEHKWVERRLAMLNATTTATAVTTTSV